MIGTRVGTYEVARPLGSGGMGVVWLARDTTLGRDVALKFLRPDHARSPEARARFLREARAAAALDHPGIAAIYQVGEHAGEPFIAMAYCQGRTLRQCLESGPLPPEEAESILRQLLEALSAAHARGIVHRDLKPGNVIVSPSGAVKVLDFGVARFAPGAGEATGTLTGEGEVLGTVVYMSPEQALGEDVDHRSDLWSLGVIAHEMLTGTHPFAAAGRQASTRVRDRSPGGERPEVGSAPSAATLLARISSTEPPSLATTQPQLPGRLVACVDALLRRDRERRPASARHAIEILDTGRPPAGRPLLGERLAMVVVGVALVLVATAGVVAWVASRPDAPSAPAASATPGVPRLVALPCQVLGDTDAAFLADAVPSTLSSLLAGDPGLAVRRPPTSLQVDPRTADVAKLARTFDATACVTCTVTSAGGSLVLDVQLVDPTTGALTWTRVREGATAQYLDMLREVASGLRGRLLAGHGARDGGVATATEPESSSEAELAFRRGTYYLDRYNNLRRPEDLAQARAAFVRTLELDPGRALAAANMGVLAMWERETSPGFDAAGVKNWMDRALAIDPRCGRAWFLAQMLPSYTPGGQGTPRDYLLIGLRAGAGGQDDPLALWSLSNSFSISSMSLSLATTRRIQEVDPLFAWGHLGEANRSTCLGDLRGALEATDRALEIEPQLPVASAYRVLALAPLGRADEAATLFEGTAGAIRSRLAPHVTGLVEAVLAAGSPDARARGSAGALFRQVVASCTVQDCVEDAVFLAAASIAAAGHPEDACLAMERFEESGLRVPYDALLLNPGFRSLHGHPRFEPILESSRAWYLESMRIIDEARARGGFPAFLEDELEAVRARVAAAEAR